MTKQYTTRAVGHRAVFLNAGQAGPASMPLRDRATVRGGQLPAWLGSLRDLDYLDANNPFFHVDRALYSLGQHLHGSIPASTYSPRPGVTILGDSGGYQFIDKPSLWAGDTTRRWVLTALEHLTDEAMTLDIPSRAVRAGTPWPTFNDALTITVESLQFFDRHRVGRTRLLNVLQGETRAAAMKWYEAVKWFPAGGWAFGGEMRLRWDHLVDMLVRIDRDGLLGGERNRIHVLGVGDLRSAVCMSAIQRGMRRRTGDGDLLITYDASSPSLLTSKAQAYGVPRLGTSEFASTHVEPPTRHRPGWEAAPFPVRHTALGARMTMGDLCVPKSNSLSSTDWDGLSLAMLGHHNLEALLFGIDAANSIFELHPDDACALAPPVLVRLCEALEAACLADDPVSYLRPFQAQSRSVGPVG